MPTSPCTPRSRRARTPAGFILRVPRRTIPPSRDRLLTLEVAVRVQDVLAQSLAILRGHLAHLLRALGTAAIGVAHVLAHALALLLAHLALLALMPFSRLSHRRAAR